MHRRNENETPDLLSFLVWYFEEIIGIGMIILKSTNLTFIELSNAEVFYNSGDYEASPKTRLHRPTHRNICNNLQFLTALLQYCQCQ